MSRSAVWVVIIITLYLILLQGSVLAVICWCSRGNTTPATNSRSLFLAYFQAAVRRMHTGCFFVKMVTPTSTHWNWRELSVTNILPKSSISLSETELCRPCFREFCAHPQATYRLKVSILSTDALKKRDIFLPTAISMTYNTTYPEQGKANLQKATVVRKPTHHQQLQWLEHTGSLSQF